MKIGIISDTHGELHPRVFTLFEGVQNIVHAGDIGSRDVLAELEALAPVLAVRGNSDRSPLADRLPDVAEMETPAGLLVVVHRPPRGAPPYASLGASRRPALVVFGHTHSPRYLADDGILLINPGSALRGRGAPATVAIISMDEDSGGLDVRFFSLSDGSPYDVPLTERHPR